MQRVSGSRPPSHSSVSARSALLLLVFVSALAPRVCKGQLCQDGSLSLDLEGEYIMVETGTRTNCSETGAEFVCCVCTGQEEIRQFMNEVRVESCASECVPRSAIAQNVVNDPQLFTCEQKEETEGLDEETESIVIIAVCGALLIIGLWAACKFGQSPAARENQWLAERKRIAKVGLDSCAWFEAFCAVHVLNGSTGGLELICVCVAARVFFLWFLCICRKRVIDLR